MTSSISEVSIAILLLAIITLTSATVSGDNSAILEETSGYCLSFSFSISSANNPEKTAGSVLISLEDVHWH